MKNIYLLLLLASLITHAQQPQPIRDNSFLLEEAFNQEKGVIQHISLFRIENNPDADRFSFTEEWPVCSEKHQLSVTMNIDNLFSQEENSGLSSLMLNYRYQFMGAENIFIAPRISGVFPLRSKNIKSKSAGFEINFPLSIILSRFWIMHFNAGANYMEEKIDDSKVNVRTNSSFSGAGFIYQPSNHFNLINEIVYTIRESSVNDATSESALTCNPGIRAALNFKSGLQIVPGISVPVEFTGGHSNAGILFYLSFEHSILKAK
jgi:hypothetical protein